MRAQLPYQRVEGRDGEDAQAAHGQLGRARGEGQQALGIGQLAALQAGQVTAEAEQVHVELLQVLLPQEDLPDDTEKRVEPPRLALSQAHWASGATAHARLARFWADGGLGERGAHGGCQDGDNAAAHSIGCRSFMPFYLLAWAQWQP